MSSFFITTPIYYVNARPHLGHAYSTIVADTMRRFHASLGEETFFLTGTDEHGDKIVRSAEKIGTDPQSFVDSVSREFRTLWPKLGIRHDRFIRTTDPDHMEKVQRFLQKVYDNGDIYFGEFGGHYCTGCERFYTEKELENGLCPQHLTKPEFIQEKNYFFRMSKYLPWLKEYIEQHPDFIRPERYRNEVLAMLEGGVLEDLCISRPKSRLSWGIELPFDTDYVCYVWFDALINYISGIDWPDGDAFSKFWPGEHLVAKDILKPHGIFWPTMLKSAGLPIYDHLNVHGYWLIRETKMSKSLGNVVDPAVIAERYGLDAFRYFLLREMPFGSDASFSEEALINRFNSDLANDLGNLFSRVLSMNAKYFGSALPPSGPVSEDDRTLMDLADESMRNWFSLFGSVQFAKALDSLWELVRALNRYIDRQAPWTLYKQGDNARLGAVLRLLMECMRKTALCLWPVMPETSEKLLHQLGQTLPESELFGTAPNYDLRTEIGVWNRMTEGTPAASSNLFPRLEMPEELKQAAEAEKQTAKAEKQARKQNRKNVITEETKPAVTFADFEKLDLRVGTVLSCERVPKADKLLLFKIDLGETEARQIVSGIAQHFKPEELVGRQVCVVANLAPRTIRGIVSQGMILTAENGDSLSLPAPTSMVPAGSKLC
ncbi:MAG: methionine--tRNA ligase [Desulfovibrionaceae bacterium]|nr:methionine--tRNA ligase [Desulfovibrionaceae bacterium]